MAMTSRELAERLARVIGQLPAQDLIDLAPKLGQRHLDATLLGVLRYQAWQAVDEARSNREQLLALANPILARVIGWNGAPLLTVEDVSA